MVQLGALEAIRSGTTALVLIKTTESRVRSKSEMVDFSSLASSPRTVTGRGLTPAGDAATEEPASASTAALAIPRQRTRR